VYKHVLTICFPADGDDDDEDVVRVETPSTSSYGRETPQACDDITGRPLVQCMSRVCDRRFSQQSLIHQGKAFLFHSLEWFRPFAFVIFSDVDAFLPVGRSLVAWCDAARCATRERRLFGERLLDREENADRCRV
jgi:hypothetical protein